MVFKNLCFLVLLTKVASALEGLALSCLEISLISVVWTFDTFQSNSKIDYKFTKFLKEGCGLDFDPDFSIKYFLNIAFVREILPK